MKKGNAERNADKSIRVQTHLSVLKTIFDNLKLDTVIEHGMGIGSTPFFHSKNINLISFENDTKWQVCDNCSGNHKIMVFEENNFKKILNDLNEKNVIVFVDGPSHERDVVLKNSIEFKIKYVVEHDAEALTIDEINLRKNLVKNEYKIFQYIKEDPETLIYIHNSLENLYFFEDYIEI